MVNPPDRPSAASMMRRDQGKCLTVQGDLTVAEVPALLRQLNQQTPQGCTEQIDLSAVRRVDSSALSLIMACSRAAGGSMITVLHAPPALRALTDLYGLQTLFRMV